MRNYKLQKIKDIATVILLIGLIAELIYLIVI